MFELQVTESTGEPAAQFRLEIERDLNITVVNERVVLRDDRATRWRVVLVAGVVFMRFSLDDIVSTRMACVALRTSGLAFQEEVARAFGHSRATQCRWEEQYRDKGIEGLVDQPLLGRRSTMPRTVEDAVVELHTEGLGMRRISRRLGLTLHEVAGVYKRRGLVAHGTVQQSLFEEAGSAGEAASTDVEVDRDDDDETIDTRAPWDGWLVPEYQTADGVVGGGVLLAVPLLGEQRVLEVFTELYETLGRWALYGLQSVVTLMVFLALWRIKRPEQLKGRSPQDLGKALGLERVPEVKTVRRKLAQLAGFGLAREAMLKLAKVRLEQEQDQLGYLYVDGHVRPYAGTYQLAKGYWVQRRMPTSATTDLWVNDGRGDPLFVVTLEINQGLTQALEPALEEVRGLVGDRRVTVIFDRGGFSPQLFARLDRAGFDVITYRKGRSRDLPVEWFESRTVEHEGQRETYLLHDEPGVRVGSERFEGADGVLRPLMMREVTRLMPETGHQTKVLTSRTDLEAEEVLWRMFNRWRQENFFKYMLQEFAIDGLVEYGCEPVPDELDRPNPEYQAICREIARVEAQIKSLQRDRGALIGSITAPPPVPEGFELFVPQRFKAEKLLGDIRKLKNHVAHLEARQAEIPKRASAGDLDRLKYERQQVATVFKMVAYNIETELVRLVAPYYARSEDEGRRLIAAALASPGSFEVTADELRVSIAPQSSPHRSKAIDELCVSLNKLGAIVPGTTLRLVLSCAPNPSPDVSSSAPGCQEV